MYLILTSDIGTLIKTMFARTEIYPRPTFDATCDEYPRQGLQPQNIVGGTWGTKSEFAQ